MQKQIEFVLQEDEGLPDPRKLYKRMKMRNSGSELIKRKKQVRNINEQMNDGNRQRKTQEEVEKHSEGHIGHDDAPQKEI